MTRPGDEWLEKIHQAGVPCGPINTVDRVLADPQVLSRGMVQETKVRETKKSKSWETP